MHTLKLAAFLIINVYILPFTEILATLSGL